MAPLYKKLLLVSFFIVSFFTQLTATNYYVRKSGDDGNNGLTPETAWLTVSKAASSSLSPGDTVIIGKGDYWERITISHSGTSDNPIVYYGDYTGEYTGDGVGAIRIGTSSKDDACKVDNKSNLDFLRIKFQGSKKRGVYLKNAENIRIRNCQFRWNTQYGIYSIGAKGFVEIVADTIYGSSTAAIFFYRSNSNLRLLIKGNYINENKYGIYLKNTNVDSVCNNVIHNINYYGLMVYYSNECNAICNNEIYNVCNYYGIYIHRSNSSKINNNTIYNIQRRGIYAYAKSSSYSIGSIEHNVIHDIWCEHGIYINRINCNKISNNTIYKIDERGIYFYGCNGYTVGAVDSNSIHDCWKEGIYLYKTRNVNSISENVIYKTTYGIYWNSDKYYTISSLSKNILFSNYNCGIHLKKNKNSILSNNLIYANKYWDCYGIYIKDNGNKTVDLKNNTIYQAGKCGIYGKNVNGTWKNNIVMGHHKWGIKGDGNFNVVDSYNCVYDNSTNWAGKASQGTGSFSEDPLFVDPDGADNVIGGSNWEDDDLHIKSTGGSWHFGAWTADDEDSPCLDTGDPSDDYSHEPEDNGDRINIGCYGNTSQASKSFSSCPITATYTDFPDSTWMLIGVPIVPWEGTPPGDPFAVFGDDFGNTRPENGTNWYCLHWTTEDSVCEYYEYDDGTIYQPPDCYPGIGYFVWHAMTQPVDVDVLGCPLTTPDTLIVAQAPEVDWTPPAPGYNMFANPFNYTTDWSNTRVLKIAVEEEHEYSLSEAAEEGWISQYAYTWNHKASQYEIIVPDEDNHSDSLSVWQGYYFVQIDSITNLKLIVPPERVLAKPSEISRMLSKLGGKYNYRTSSVSKSWDWFLKLSVFSDDYKMQDAENGIGVSSQATDDFDGWDAFDFRGTDMWGNFVQLQFVNSDGRTFAYDIHSIFDVSSEWKIKIITNSWNVDKNFSLSCPQIRLVPETVKFSLYDSDKTLLVDDLRANDSYDFSLPDSTRIFYIRATKVQDETSPEFSFVISQNIFAPNDLTVYIVPSEPLVTIQADFDETPADLTEIPSPPYVYYGKKYLSGSGSLQLNVSGTDASGNSGTGSTTIQYQLMKISENNKLVNEDAGVKLIVPAGV
ncbi:MAG: hypothetical protein DRP89_05830, partial [Candidatus Neomarinimicrobiota bacterium]